MLKKRAVAAWSVGVEREAYQLVQRDKITALTTERRPSTGEAIAVK
jgi:hypothetical protein